MWYEVSLDRAKMSHCGPETNDPRTPLTCDRYIGKLLNGKQFDANTAGAPFNFRLGAGEVIKGWDQGVAGMAVGGERKLTVSRLPPQPPSISVQEHVETDHPRPPPTFHAIDPRCPRLRIAKDPRYSPQLDLVV